MKYLTVLALILSSPAFAATATYTCNGMGSAKGGSVKLEILNKSEVKVDGDLAKIDRNYKPRGNTGFERFEYVQSDEGVSEVLVQSKLVDGEDKGLIKIQNRGEGFGTDSYFCHP
jgi:hypothetical protein